MCPSRHVLSCSEDKVYRTCPKAALHRVTTSQRYGTKCGGCGQGISPSDLVRKARDKVFHLNCFTCLVCRKQLSTGEELYVLDDNKFICKEDYLSGNKSAVITSPPPGQVLKRRSECRVTGIRVKEIADLQRGNDPKTNSQDHDMFSACQSPWWEAECQAGLKHNTQFTGNTLQNKGTAIP
ncbi:hypothetical protein NQ318_005752 [Aromia moschata]|uniref:LIM zinc-binding domain-containing protein n=1 Tax=Aromia moschata TaxID=1265417 RepID=A0AAV8YQF2_9CUCU|nr:hypothetical protein NQ318_005752 [Aromia moschata]